MIIVKLKGGLGNQMFQYATGRAVSVLNDVNFKLDRDWFDRNRERDTYRKYSLDIFNFEARFAKKSEILKLKLKDLVSKISSFLLISKRKRYYLKGKKDKFIGEILKSKDAYLDGYWQSYKYFDDIKSILQQDFKINIKLKKKNKETLNKIKNSHSVAVHIRRGDYIKNEKINKVFNVCDIKYYNKSINLIKKNVKSPAFFIFSNDIEWAKKNFKKGSNICFVEGNEAPIDMYLMKKCKHNIIANSSFSWWPAYLNSNENKTVIAPKKWFKSQSRSSANRIPDEWIRI